MNKTGIMKAALRGVLTTGLLTVGLLVGLLAGQLANGAESPGGTSYPELPELNWEQRSDWVNVKTDVTPRAVGDGVADDTAALQAAFDLVDDTKSTVYIPPGTYRITRTIGRFPGTAPGSARHIRGHGRSSRVVWDGPEGGTMFLVWSFGSSTYIGTVWDGRGIAARGFMHDGGNESKVRHEHQAFMNFTDTGSGTTKGPRAVGGYLEGSQWKNCLFINCGYGLTFWQFNDYVFTIDGCEFHDNGYGVWGDRGQFYVRNSHFHRSKNADIHNNNSTHGCSARRCTSLGSRVFYSAPGGGPIFTIQDCHVSGWTNPDGAIISGNAANMLIFDCVFTNAPSANPPIRLNRPKPVVHSNNTTSTAQLFGESTEHVIEIPRGERRGSISSARQSFFKSEATIPTRVFDAKRDFGAKADGRSDDSDAVQRTIIAAAQHGRGAIAYLPRGFYRLSKTINIAGGDYYVGGAGAAHGITTITWSGDAHGPVFLVSDPQNVTLENLGIYINHGPNTLVGIRQVSTTKHASRMHYNHVYISDRRNLTTDKNASFEVVGLSKDSILTTDFILSTWMSIDNSSAARILLGYKDVARIHVKGTQADRSGFLGLLASQGQFLIEDNHSFVGGDCYQEQMNKSSQDPSHLRHTRAFPYAQLRGSPKLPAGRVTISSPQMAGRDWGSQGPTGTGPFEEYFTVDNYHGQLSSVMADYYNPGNFQGREFDPGKKAFKVVCSGEAALDVLLMANQYGQSLGSPGSVPPVIEGGSNVTRTLIGNWYYGRQSAPVPNVVHANSQRVAAQALDHFRELGELDLELNHTEK